jgi:serine/threonine-protein kinase
MSRLPDVVTPPASPEAPALLPLPSGLERTEPTFTLQPLADGAPGAKPGPKPAGGIHHGKFLDAESLLRVRLRAASGFLSITLGSLIAWHVLTGGGGPLVLVQAVIVATLAATYTLLAGLRTLSDRWLRVLEFVIFGLAAVFLSVRQYQGILDWLPVGDQASILSALKTTLISSILLIVAYCMMIPNTWRSAAGVTVALAAVPFVTQGALYALFPDAYRLAWPFTTFPRVAEDVALMFLAAGVSVYGAFLMNRLRIEATEARQLNQYRLVKQLGKGGMGDVYLAEHRLLKRPCAVKLIRPDSAADPIELARFEREVRATARLSHPNIVDVFDYGRAEDGTFYYVMEYLPGLSLEELIKRFGPMPPGRVIYLLEQVCGALAEAHAEGLVHRDVKPGNIFASRRGGRCDVAKLLDFGLVKGPALGIGGEPSDVSRAGMIRGTPLYMAPEQILPDHEIDHRVDLYALGAVAYRLLTGHPPFVRETGQEVMAAHAHEAVLPPSRHQPGIPADLERIVLRSLAKSPDDRYPDAESLSAALSSCAAAAEWDAHAAVRWWLEHAPEAIAPLPSALLRA